MANINARLVGLELYFEDLTAAKRFYEGTLGLALSGEQSGHHAQFNAGAAFLCLEKKGVEDYPSRDKAVVFLEVPSVEAAINAIGRDRILRFEPAREGERPAWAVLQDPEGHSVLLLEARGAPRTA